MQTHIDSLIESLIRNAKDVFPEARVVSGSPNAPCSQMHHFPSWLNSSRPGVTLSKVDTCSGYIEVMHNAAQEVSARPPITIALVGYDRVSLNEKAILVRAIQEDKVLVFYRIDLVDDTFTSAASGLMFSDFVELPLLQDIAHAIMITSGPIRKLVLKL